jgi:rubredoxin
MRLIDADALIKWLSEWELQESPGWGANGYGDAKVAETIKEAIDAVEKMPTIDPVKRGKWDVDRYMYMTMTCSVCGWIFEHYGGLDEEWNYCPHCGSKNEVDG